MARASRTWIVAALLASGAAVVHVAFETPTALAGDEKKKCVDQADVYVGDAKKWDKPAEVNADKVYAKIDEYKQIVDGGLKPGDAKYDILMAKASKRFCAAVKKTAKDGGYDLVAKIGAVKGCPSAPPDITSDVIANL